MSTKWKVALILAGIGSVLGVIAVIISCNSNRTSHQDAISMWCYMIAVLLAIVSYILAGFGTAFRMAGKIAKWGWIIIPFPYDLLSGIMSFVFAIMAFFILPIIPVYKAYKTYKASN